MRHLTPLLVALVGCNGPQAETADASTATVTYVAWDQLPPASSDGSVLLVDAGEPIIGAQVYACDESEETCIYQTEWHLHNRVGIAIDSSDKVNGAVPDHFMVTYW